MKIGLFGSFALAAIAVFALTLNASAGESFNFNSARLGVVLGLLVLLHLSRYPRFLFCREFALYFIFVGYMVVELFWTADVTLAMNTLVPALNFVLILVLFGALVTYHDFRAVLSGTLGGLLIGAAFYTLTQGFPFVYPVGFSYNAIAGMYLFGLFITLVYGWYTRSRVLTLSIGLSLLVLIAATTSIKTNLGILLGVTGAGLMYFKTVTRVLRRNAILFVALAGMITYAVVSDDALVERVQAGVDRVSLGVQILTAREELSGGYVGFALREEWADAGLKGFAENPLFGHGVEAFRDRYGTTSHSTPVDLLYNSGLIGFVLFYAIFISMAWRLFHACDTSLGSLRALIFGAFVCYLFISLSGTMHYNAFLAVFIAISTALLHQHRRKTSRAGVSSRNVL